MGPKRESLSLFDGYLGERKNNSGKDGAQREVEKVAMFLDSQQPQ